MAVVAACSVGPSADLENTNEVTVFGPWRRSAATQFRTVLESFEEQTGIDVRYIGAADFAGDIVGRTNSGDPPDVAIFPQPGLMNALADVGHVLPLPPDLVEVARSSYRPELLDLGSRFGEVFGLPYRIHAKSLVWYSPRAFEERGYRIPKDWAELQSLLARMDEAGEAAWCLGVEAFGASGWPATDWVEDILLRMSGTETYDRWVAGEVSFLDQEVSDAFAIFAIEALAGERSLGGRRGVLNTSTANTQDPMFESPPRCLMHRQASFYRNNLPEGVTVGPDGDTDVFLFPPVARGEPNPLLIGGDLAAALSDRDETWALMSYLATPESGVQWAQRGQYVSPHRGFDSADYSSEFDARMDRVIAGSEVIRFDGSDMMPPAVGTGTFLEAMLMFIANDRLQDALRHAQSGYDR